MKTELTKMRITKEPNSHLREINFSYLIYIYFIYNRVRVTYYFSN